MLRYDQGATSQKWIIGTKGGGCCACSSRWVRKQTAGPRSFLKVRAVNHCATSPNCGEVLSLAPCYNPVQFLKTEPSEEKEVDVVLGEVAWSKEH